MTMEDTMTLNEVEQSDDPLHLKEIGNQYFKKGVYDHAIAYYHKAISNLLNGILANGIGLPNVDKRTKAICLTNMAQCHIKLEEFGTLFSCDRNLP